MGGFLVLGLNVLGTWETRLESGQLTCFGYLWESLEDHRFILLMNRIFCISL